MAKNWICLGWLITACLPRDELSSYSQGADRPPSDHEAVSAEEDDEQGQENAPAMPGPPAIAPSDTAAAPSEVAPSDTASPGLESPSPDALPSGNARVASYSPEDQAAGVAGNTGLTITFAQAMDAVSVRGAFESATLPLDAATFTWSDSDRQLHVAFDPPLTEAQGTDPRAVEPLCHRYRIGASALDLSGRQLEASEVGFCTRRRIRQAFSAVLDRNLTGNWRSDGAYGDGDCLREGTALCVGDSGFAPNQQYRSLLSFDVSSVPAASLQVTSAVLQLTVRSVQGQPFADLASLLLEAVEFEAIGDAAFSTPAVEALGELRPETSPAGVWRGDVAAALPRAAGGLSQYRLRFESATDSDFTSDNVVYEQAAELRVDYFIP